MTLNYIEIGRNISTARKAAKMSQSDLANQVGTEQGHISRVENGMKAPNLELIVNIANTLGTGVDVLLGSNLKNGGTKNESTLDLLISNFTSTEKEILTRLFILLADNLNGHLK